MYIYIYIYVYIYIYDSASACDKSSRPLLKRQLPRERAERVEDKTSEEQVVAHKKAQDVAEATCTLEEVHVDSDDGAEWM